MKSQPITLIAAAFVVGTLTLVGTSRAETVYPITNYNFESQTLTSPTFVSGISGWTTAGNTYTQLESDTGMPTDAGADTNWAVIDMRNVGRAFLNVTTIDTTQFYTLEFDIAQRSSGNAGLAAFEVGLYTDADNSGGITLVTGAGTQSPQFAEAGGTLAYLRYDNLNPSQTNFDVANITPALTVYRATITLDATQLAASLDGEELYIGMFAARVSGNAYQVLFDDFTLTSVTIPTPAALSAGLAMIGLAAVRRRRN